jgi:cyclase
MNNKRIIYELIYEDGFFCLSRNFKLQKIGDLSWLLKAYNMAETAKSIDELVVVDASRGERNLEQFTSIVRSLSKEIFVPLTLGGGINSSKQIEILLRSGADKVLINSLYQTNQEQVVRFIRDFGQQFIVMGIDLKLDKSGNYVSYFSNGSSEGQELSKLIEENYRENAGEILIKSIDRDGTGQGLDLEILNLVPKSLPIPLILAGGTGKGEHISAALQCDEVSAVATSNLLNFIGDGLYRAREEVRQGGTDLPEF